MKVNNMGIKYKTAVILLVMLLIPIPRCAMAGTVEKAIVQQLNHSH